MYSPERVQWWLSRTQSKAHQHVYNLIASQITPTSKTVVVDYCCGNAELLKKLYERWSARASKKISPSDKDPPLLIGTDVTKEMITQARDNLRSAGIESTVLKDVSNLMNHRGVVLLEDDLADSRLPPEISDVSLLTLPEMKINTGLPIVSRIISRYDPQSPNDLGYLVQKYWLSRVTKRGSQVILCDYDRSEGEKSSFDRMGVQYESETGRYFGLKLIRTVFIKDKKLFLDIEKEEQGKIKREMERSNNQGGKLGCRIYYYTKTGPVPF